MKSTLWVIFILFLSTLLFQSSPTALASNPAPDSASTEALLQRAKEYWDFKIKGEFDKALKYEDPKTVEGMTLADYTRSVGGGVKWLGATPEKAVIDGNKASVYLKLRYMWTFIDPGQQNPKGFEQPFWDHWNLVDGKWYHKFKSYKKSAEQLGAKKIEGSGGKAKETAPATKEEPKESPSKQ